MAIHFRIKLNHKSYILGVFALHLVWSSYTSFLSHRANVCVAECACSLFFFLSECAAIRYLSRNVFLNE